MDRRFGVVFDNAPELSDDLTRIGGVRKQEAIILNRIGVYFWGQVALWRHREMSAIADELQISVGRMVDEVWTEQAKNLCSVATLRKTSTLPASPVRTISVLLLALLSGILLVYVLGQHRNQPLTGILSADITTIRVPAASRLTSIRIKPGEEVFSGQPLLTLEKLEHLAMIESHEIFVRDLEREVKRVEAQAAIELEWRTRELNRELSNIRQRVAVRELEGRTASHVSDANVPEGQGGRLQDGKPVRSISASNAAGLNSGPLSRAGGMIFFSGASGNSSAVLKLARTPDVPVSVRTAPTTRNALVSDSETGLLVDPDLQTLRAEQSRLEAVRTSLPSTVKEAVGATTIQAQYAEAARQLESMKTVSRVVNVTSPVYGTVGLIPYREGDDMQAGEVMLRILHTDRRYVTAYLPTRRVREMRPGQEVELRFPGNEEFRGQVVDIPMVAELTGQTGDTLAAIRIEQVGRLWPNVPVGSQIDVISVR